MAERVREAKRPPLLLLLDTSGAEGTLALAELGPAPRVLRRAQMPARSASERLIGAVRELLAEAGLAPGDLDAIGVVRGPGSFTGVRIGVAATKGLAEALAIPVLGFSRLAVMAAARAAVEASEDEVIALLDAGRGEVFAGRYRRDGERVWEELLTPEAAVVAAAGAELIACELVVLERVGDAVAVATPDASAMLPLAAARWVRGRFDAVETLDALYLRRTAAEIAARSREKGEQGSGTDRGDPTT